MKSGVQKVLSLPGVHFLITRFGPQSLRKRSFDEKFRDGSWNFAVDKSSELVCLLEKYARNGHVLMLGCGTAGIASVLDPHKFESLLGVDISEEAISRAKKHETDKVSFQVGDMVAHQCARNYDLIVFLESFYYVGTLQRKRLLRSLAKCMTHRGRVVITLSQPNRYAGILKMIRRNFHVDEDRFFAGSNRYLIVFH
jgi:predicted TPR repeat methyltransferase